MIVYTASGKYFDTEKSDIIFFSDDPEKARIYIDKPGPAGCMPSQKILNEKGLFRDPSGAAAYNTGDLKTARKYMLSVKDLKRAKWRSCAKGQLHAIDNFLQEKEETRKQEEEARQEEYIKKLKKHGLYDEYTRENARAGREAREKAFQEGLKTRWARVLHRIHKATNYKYNPKYYSYDPEKAEPVFILMNTETNDWDDPPSKYAGGKRGNGKYSLSELERLFPEK